MSEQRPSKTPCAQCGMPVGPDQYHPYAACLMFKQCHDSRTAQDNLWAVVDYGRSMESETT